jgi:5-formyltetrahydrofolate cyclo-ligase
MAARTSLDEAARAKQEVRERIWSALQRRHIARFPGARGRIPNFVGAERAAALLAEQPEWRRARVIKANPDSPQLPVRSRALAAGKRLYMAVPRLREPKPFILLEPADLTVPPHRAASIEGASRYGHPVGIDELKRIDLVVCGTVAVNEKGVRIGKGGGYSDLEFGLLLEALLVDERTVIVTTVHDLQVVEEELPETAHDFRVDLIVTPSGVRRTRRRKRPGGILWSHLEKEKIAAIPALVRMPRAR